MPNKVRVAEIKIDHAKADKYSEDMIYRGIYAATKEAESIAVDLVSQPGTGRVYRRNGTFHQASAPGESPAVDTGALRQSIDSTIGPTDGGARGIVSATQSYAVNLEFGTERMAPRPFLSRIQREFLERIKATFVAFARK